MGRGASNFMAQSLIPEVDIIFSWPKKQALISGSLKTEILTSNYLRASRTSQFKYMNYIIILFYIEKA